MSESGQLQADLANRLRAKQGGGGEPKLGTSGSTSRLVKVRGIHDNGGGGMPSTSHLGLHHNNFNMTSNGASSSSLSSSDLLYAGENKGFGILASRSMPHLETNISSNNNNSYSSSSSNNNNNDSNDSSSNNNILNSSLSSSKSISRVDLLKDLCRDADVYKEMKKSASITTSSIGNKMIRTLSPDTKKRTIASSSSSFGFGDSMASGGGGGGAYDDLAATAESKFPDSAAVASNSMMAMSMPRSNSTTGLFSTSKISTGRLTRATFFDSLRLTPKQLHSLQNVPRTFFYLKIRGVLNEKNPSEGGGSGSVYDLEIVPQEQIDKSCYFTLSKEGVTYCSDKSSTFTSLTQWEREYALFNKIAQINFFKLYKRWKAFTFWKTTLTGKKRNNASEKLQSELFLFNPPLRRALLEVRTLTMPLAKMGMLTISPTETYLVDDLSKITAQAHDSLRMKLDALSAQVLICVRAACDDVVDEFLKANNITANHKMTFMERAALRAQCKRLTRFLRVIDIMMSDFLRTMVLDAMKKLETSVERKVLTPLVENADPKELQKARLAQNLPTPLFRVMVNFKKDLSEMSNLDSPQASVNSMVITPSLDALTRCLDGMTSSCLDVVNSFVKVFSAPETEMYVMPDTNDEESDGAEVVSLSVSIRANMQFASSREVIFKSMRHSYIAVRDFVRVFEPYRVTYFQNISQSQDVSSIFDAGTLDAFTEAIAHFKAQIDQFKGVPRYSDVGSLLVDSDDMKKQLTPSPIACLNSIRDFIPLLCTKRAQELLDEVGNMNPIIGGDPSTVEAYVLKKKTKEMAITNMEDIKSRQNYCRSLVLLMDDNQWIVPDNAKALIRMLKDSIQLLETNIQLADGKEEEEGKRFAVQITEEVPKLLLKVAGCREQLDAALISDVDADDIKVIKYLTGVDIEFSKIKARTEKVQEYQGILKLPVDEFEALEEVQADLQLKIRLWNDKQEWARIKEAWMGTEMKELDVALMERELQKFNKTIFLASRTLVTNKVVPMLKDSIDSINPLVPIITNLRSPTLRDRHWEKINDLVKLEINHQESFKLEDLIAINPVPVADDISTVATSALQESILEEMMLKVTTIWEKLELDVKPYKEHAVKDLYVLGDTSEVVASLDDSLVTINTVLGSRYVAGIRAYVDTWRGKLMHMQETLDEWLMCQKNWMYLEVIFGSADIVRQLPGPAKIFQMVDKSWKLIMKQTNDDRNALKAGTHDRSRKDTFISHNANLDQIQKDLEEYLETKRMAFPRFYFLSNDELLEILSQAKEPRAVQPHLRKCFDNLVKLEFGSEEGSIDIIAMFSSENERVLLGKNLKARGNVEEWLTGLERRMKDTLTIAMKAGLVDYDTRSRTEWLGLHPGQVVATVAQMTWARDTEKALRSPDPINSMVKWFADYKVSLQDLIGMIRGTLTKLQRYIIVALVTTDVHARDIIDELCEREVTGTHDFLWQQQLRYYWETSIDNCQICHSDAKILYGYEYMGATSRLVITPLTDRCWLTLTGSYALKLGGNPSGPAGTGKTESSKDLAKAMAICCVVFNCSDQIDYKMMGKLFRGLAQGGGWICLDEFNRIDIEVLSVIAQQLLVLREGRIAKKAIINFMGITIPLVDHHVIITMNPGYAGRTELPDNLQVCFRPVSMMVPNYALIAEIMLFAEGFGDAKNLSRKMCKLYILCSEQLSQQPHYDYGLRAVKSVLVMAGSLKRSNPTVSEELVLIRALRDSNVPKFLSDDLPLFAAIVQDLFPGVEIPSNDYGELQVALEEELMKAGLQKVPAFIGKVIQMFDIFNIRFGATLVGPAGTGKSTCWQILAALMTNLRDKGSKNSEFQRVKFRILNPKSITMGELYGEFHPLTQEWHDGLASSIMREFVGEEGDEKRWTIFDGPIDALWIENMNTVLDDNMTLCLANGQRIKLKWEMKCLFEVNDLAVASPATVSRIGVVFMSPSDLGWFPYVQSWAARAIPACSCQKDVADRLVFLFEKVFPKGLAFQRKMCKEPVESVDVQLVINTCILFQSLFTAENGVKFTDPVNVAEVLTIADKIFFFSYIWSVGAPCASQFWEAFSEHAREIFDEPVPQLGLPGGGTAFDYFIDIKDGRFRDWNDIVPAFKYSSEVPYFDLMVPTTDTCRFSYLMKTLITVNKPVFITGVTGTGKTVAIQNLLNSLQPMPYDGGMGLVPVFMNFSAQTKSAVVQSSIESKLEKKRKNLLGAPSGKKIVVFVDDVNMPLVETYGAQPPVELLRQFLDYKGMYDRDKLFWKDFVDVLLFVAAAPPGGGRAVVTGRFTRHFNVMCMPPASEAALTSIFSQILGGFLSTKFEPEVQKLVSGTVQATVDIYNKISEDLLPTPAKFHYTFNLRDISKVFQGILMIRPRKCPTADVFAKLWIHEASRIFYDRLINNDDQEWFKKTVLELMSRYFKMSFTYDDLFLKPIVFADFIKPDSDNKLYEPISDLPKLTFVLNDVLDNYNMTFPTQMNLVFFQDALTHTARIARILRQPRGNAMLIGVGGSGKQSLTRIASFVCQMACLSIEINRGYGIKEFREDIKKFMIKTGVEGKDTVFLFTDTQIIVETMLEDLNNVLNTGEVSNLFPQDETDKIVGDMLPILKQANIPETRDNCLAYFVSRVRDKLHIVLCMSPVGDALRIRCRQFPSLINCTTIDWFHGWPEAALVSVAQRFLSNLELPSEEIRASMVKMCGLMHRSIEIYSVRFFNELRRKIYTTPKSYLDLINLYMGMLKNLQNVVDVKCERMKVGVKKLFETNAIVDSLRSDLMKLEPILKEKAIETESLLQQVATDSAEAAIVATKVQAEEAVVGKQAAETKAVQEDAQRDLDRALPALESAVKALKSLTKADITEVKSFTNPPKAVQVVLEAVCTLLGEKETWDSAKKLMSRSDFMDLLTGYDKDNIDPARLKKLRKNYINAEEMQPETIQKVSRAGTGLCLWARAMDVYADVAKEVGPKKERLELMNQQLAVTTAALKVKQDLLKSVQDKVAALQKTADETMAEKNRLQQESDTTAKRLVRAEKLTNGLNSEGERWKQSIIVLSQEKTNLIGDVFLSCGCISYYGGFSGTFRDDLVNMWLRVAAENNIPCSPKFSLASTLGDPVRIREWQTQGLPTDPVSVNNGILVDKCRRWPLMIDPQMQANQWIRKMEEKNRLLVTTMNDGNLLRALENCIRLGRPLLLESCEEQIEPALEPVLQKATFKIGARLLIRLGDSDVDYDTNFKLYMTSKLPNPHYLPEVCIKVTLINFTVTMEGLESQLLGDVVKAERPDIEQRKISLMLQMAEDKKALAALEAKILQMLSESEGNILDDEVLINTLSESKMTSMAISERVSEAEVTETEINEARMRYLPVATRGSIIYFVIADLALIDPMYQYSLAYYNMLFNRCINEAEKSNDLEKRLKFIIDYTTWVVYVNICRGLFEKDKLLFSASICFQILRQTKEIHDLEWNIFMRGAGAIDRTKQPLNPQPDKILIPQWDLSFAMEGKVLYRTSLPEPKSEEEAAAAAPKKKNDDDDGGEEEEKEDLSNYHPHSHAEPFKGFCESVKVSYDTPQVLVNSDGSTTQLPYWKSWFESDNLMTAPLPEPYQSTVNEFQRLILVKALREDKLQSSIAQFVAMKLGPQFAVSPNSTMEDVYKDLDCRTPCIFVLSPGADPTGMLLRFAKKMNYSDKLHIVSLGQGQGPTATRLVEHGLKTGDWVVMQNCMLSKSWMPNLDKLVFEYREKALLPDGGGVHKDFRLFLTSLPCDYFPVAVLQNGVKMTNEPPRGFRANLLRSFGNLVKEEDFECMAALGADKVLQWKKLLCGLTFFHANVQERRKFGPLGWNIRYSFDESDFETSIAVLRRFINEQEIMPWDALNFVTGHINYGGRVTDDWDRRTLISILSMYMTPEILNDNYKFSSSGLYKAPPGTPPLASILDYFNSMPLRDNPEVFGMHDNANVTFNTNESLLLMETMLSLQPRASGGGSGVSSDDIVVSLANSFEDRCPRNLSDDEAGATTFIIQSNGLLTSLAICLTQEMVKFNRLLDKMRSSLRDIKKAIRGMIVMSADLDALYTAFLNNRLPGIWEKVSFASLKSLASWVNDLLFRVAFMRLWLTSGQPACFPLPVFFFPQGFMTASLQTFARRHMVAIDGLGFKYKILPKAADEITEGPADGVIIYGLYMEGARFDLSANRILDSRPGKMYDLLPTIHFIPEVNHKQAPNTYACPVYKTAVRKGVLSTTGMSTNYVVPIELPISSSENENKWILAGVAALCNLTD